MKQFMRLILTILFTSAVVSAGRLFPVQSEAFKSFRIGPFPLPGLAVPAAIALLFWFIVLPLLYRLFNSLRFRFIEMRRIRNLIRSRQIPACRAPARPRIIPSSTEHIGKCCLTAGRL